MYLTVEEIQKQQQIPIQDIPQNDKNVALSTTRTPGNTMNRLDSEMSHILYSTYYKDDREKWKANVSYFWNNYKSQTLRVDSNGIERVTYSLMGIV